MPMNIQENVLVTLVYYFSFLTGSKADVSLFVLSQSLREWKWNSFKQKLNHFKLAVIHRKFNYQI